MFPTFIDCYMIVIKDNKTSEYYADYCTESWKKIGLDVKRFDAITPKDLPKLKEIKWHKYSTQMKYKKLDIKVEITDTEKSCFYSHYMLWKKCIDKNTPILILEHDAYLEDHKNLWFDMSYGIIFFDKASMGSYVIFPWFAKLLIEFIKKHTLGMGPYATIENCSVHYKTIDLLVNGKHKKFKAASNQVMSDIYGNTVEHFCNSNPNLFNIKHFHEFKKI